MPLGTSSVVSQGVDYDVDLVMCIDATGSMSPVIKEVKENALSFYGKFVEAMEKQEPPKTVANLRVKVIAFRDYGVDSEPMVESKFFKLDEEKEAFSNFVNGITASGGGDGPENSLEALALAMKSDWVHTGTVRRHVIMMFTDAPALDLSARAGKPGYPSDMPKNMAELRELWEGQYMETRAKRLLIYAPDCEPWSGMTDWENTFHTPSRAGAGCSDADMEICINLLVKSI